MEEGVGFQGLGAGKSDNNSGLDGSSKGRLRDRLYMYHEFPFFDE